MTDMNAVADERKLLIFSRIGELMKRVVTMIKKGEMISLSLIHSIQDIIEGKELSEAYDIFLQSAPLLLKEQIDREIEHFFPLYARVSPGAYDMSRISNILKYFEVFLLPKTNANTFFKSEPLLVDNSIPIENRIHAAGIYWDDTTKKYCMDNFCPSEKDSSKYISWVCPDPIPYFCDYIKAQEEMNIGERFLAFREIPQFYLKFMYHLNKKFQYGFPNIIHDSKFPVLYFKGEENDGHWTISSNIIKDKEIIFPIAGALLMKQSLSKVW